MDRYVVMLHGIEHTVLLNSEDAQRLNAMIRVTKPVEAKAVVPANKSREASHTASRMHPKG